MRLGRPSKNNLSKEQHSSPSLRLLFRSGFKKWITTHKVYVKFFEVYLRQKERKKKVKVNHELSIEYFLHDWNTHYNLHT